MPPYKWRRWFFLLYWKFLITDIIVPRELICSSRTPEIHSLTQLQFLGPFSCSHFLVKNFGAAFIKIPCSSSSFSRALGSICPGSRSHMNIPCSGTCQYRLSGLNALKISAAFASLRKFYLLWVYKNNELVGFGRAVTDYSTVYWVCDIIIDERHRGKGLSKKLMEHIMGTGEFDGLKGILATEDAHGLYKQYGFIKEPHKFMIKKRTKN